MEVRYFKKNRSVEEYPISSHVIQVRVDDIRPNRAQPRADFDNNSIIRPNTVTIKTAINIAIS